MAEDKLIFPIGFDLEKGVKEAQKNADGYLRRIEDAIKKHPISVKMQLEQESKLSSTVKAETQRAAKELTGLKKEMAAINQEWNALSAKDRGGEVGARLMAQYRALKQEANGYISTVAAAVKEEDRLARQREKSANAAAKAAQKTKEYNKELQEQDGYLSRLIKRLIVYAGFSAVRNFLTGIREVTAEFELQRVSLGAIIQDQQRANQLFSEIKSFALKSPIKILDLTKYVKQVAAYRIETDKLFDTTKRLADVSVGLGVDMGRLVLAYGQVKAASYLRAAEIRQFTEAGIPMLELLADKFTEIQGKAVSTEQVMDMVSKRAVSFSMVEEIFKDMTDAGGMFYNMQEKQAQTLFGMWSKLGDAAAVMYEQIGNVGWVNEFMKTGIGLLEKMMRNWQTTARVLDTIAVSLGVYVIGLKNAAVASKALTSAEAIRLGITKRQIIETPKLIASIVGQNTAIKLSTTFTRAHIAATLRHAKATNILTKGFWKLTAAMLANPWVLAAAAIAAVGAALFHFIGNAETATERAEKLNNSVAEFKNFENTVTPLIDTYNELINKTERTAAEEKKLSAVTHELANRYPGAITAIGDFGNEIDLAADKLNDLYQAEKKARMENTREELAETEKKIKETKDKIVELQNSLNKGTQLKWKAGGEAGEGIYIEVAMSSETRKRISNEIDILRSELFGLQQAAEAAEAAIKGITIDQLRIDKFGGWKEELQGFSKVVDGLNMGKPIKLFDDTTINGFNSLYDALEEVAKQYKTNKALAEQYAKTLESKTISDETRAQTEELKAEAETMAELSYAALVRFNALKLLQTSGGGGSDTRLQNLKEIEQTLTAINKKYEELVKKEGNTAALDYVKENYASTLEYVNKLGKKFGKKFGLKFEMPTDFKDLQTYRKNIQKVIETLKMEGYEKAAIELELKIAEGNQDKLEKQIEKQLKELADKISRTKTAKDFFNKILEQTGDINFATNVSMSIYGDTGKDLFKEQVEQIKEVFKTGSEEHPIDIDISAAIDVTNQRINYKTLDDIYRKYQNDIIEKNRDTAKNIVREGQKTAAENILTWQKELAKAKSFEEQRTDIINRETQRRADIIKSDLPQDEKQQMVSLSYDKQAKELADIDVKEFRGSETFIRMFENLDKVATSSLKRMREEIKRVIETDKDMSPENMKTMVDALEKIEDQINGRGFGNVMIQSVKDYIQATKNLHEAQTELKAAQTEYKAQEPKLDADIATAKQEKDTADADVVEKERVLLEIKQQEEVLRQQEIIDEEQLAILRDRELNADIDLVAAQGRQLLAANNVTKAENNKEKAAKKVKKAEDEVTEEQNNQSKASSNFFKDLAKVGDTADKLAGELSNIKDFLGVADDSAAGLVFDSAIAGLQQMSNLIGIVTTAQEIYNAVTESNPWIAVAAAVLAVISALAFGIGQAKVRKANKEIEKQQEILDQLEYSYDRLEKAAEKAFGGDYIKNFKDQQKNLQAQIAATQKQLAAEQSKGKKADDDKIKEYKEQIRDLKDELADMQGTLAEHFLGTDLTSAARDFAKAWLDAYKEFGNTADAMSEKFQEMIENMVVEGAMAAVMERALKPMFDLIDEMDDDDFYSQDFWREVSEKAKQGAKDADAGASTLMKFLEGAGISIRDLGGDLTGISRDIASASEESINGLAATMNTWSYYVSYVPQIAQNVAALRAILEGGVTPIQSGQGVTDLVTLQNQSLTHLQDISRHTAETVTECRRIADRCTAMAEDIHRVVVPKGTKGSYAVQTQVS